MTIEPNDARRAIFFTSQSDSYFLGVAFPAGLNADGTAFSSSGQSVYFDDFRPNELLAPFAPEADIDSFRPFDRLILDSDARALRTEPHPPDNATHNAELRATIAALPAADNHIDEVVADHQQAALHREFDAKTREAQQPENPNSVAAQNEARAACVDHSAARRAARPLRLAAAILRRLDHDSIIAIESRLPFLTPNPKAAAQNRLDNAAYARRVARACLDLTLDHPELSITDFEALEAAIAALPAQNHQALEAAARQAAIDNNAAVNEKNIAFIAESGGITIRAARDSGVAFYDIAVDDPRLAESVFLPLAELQAGSRLLPLRDPPSDTSIVILTIALFAENNSSASGLQVGARVIAAGESLGLTAADWQPDGIAINVV